VRPFLLGGIIPRLFRTEGYLAKASVRRVNLKASLRDVEVATSWKFTMEEVLPTLRRVPGMRSVKMSSGGGGLRADICSVFEMDDAGVYARLLADAQLCPLIAKTYAAWDMATAARHVCGK